MNFSLINIEDAAAVAGTSQNAIMRMVREGLLLIVRADGEACVRERDIISLCSMNRDDPHWLTCECPGPCKCYGA